MINVNKYKMFQHFQKSKDPIIAAYCPVLCASMPCKLYKSVSLRIDGISSQTKIVDVVVMDLDLYKKIDGIEISRMIRSRFDVPVMYI